MKRNILVMGLFFSFIICIYGQHPFSPYVNPEISRIESYDNGKLISREEYVKEGNKVIVYSTDIRLMQTHINREYILSDSVKEIIGFDQDGFKRHYSKQIYLNGMLKLYEYENKYRYDGTGLKINSDRIEYFYDSNGNILREVGRGFERDYIYTSGNLTSIETENIRGERRTEKVERINSNVVHTPNYDFMHVMVDKKVIENKIEGETRTTTIKYYIDEEIYQEQEDIYVNDRIICRRIYTPVYKRSERKIQETRFFYRSDVVR